MEKASINPDKIFEISWEVCNKIGGIHTVISTRAKTMVDLYGDNYILIGPDVYRGTEEHPEFQEDEKILSDWRMNLESSGYRVKIGRWKVSGHPIVVLVDFSKFIGQKDKIFTNFWENFGLDSLAGGWDYVEPALFGYVSGKLLESFYSFYLQKSSRVVAHFHEWLTGTGLLYLKEKAPYIATVFTTHATTVGRAIAGNQNALYSNLPKYNGDLKALDLNVVSKHSLEKLAAKHSDSFTTVSDITAIECKQFLEKEVDLVTPNGFEDSFVPDSDELKLRRFEARIKFYEVAEALLAYEVPKDSMIVATSGRYEFKNKGLDVFIESLARLNKSQKLDKTVLAFILVPAGHHGPRRDVFRNLQDQENVVVLDNKHITHYLNDVDNDPILAKIAKSGLNNEVGDKVKIFYVPCYLDGNDGIFNYPYYYLLTGIHLTMFASYYEPWGYTPLESLAFSIPTFTTNLAGFGIWIQEKFAGVNNGVSIINRNDYNEEEVISSLVKGMLKFSNYSEAEKKMAFDSARKLSQSFLWQNFIQFYQDAYSVALNRAEDRVNLYIAPEKVTGAYYFDKQFKFSKPKWKRLIISQKLPEKLKRLDDLAKNLYWSWNPEVMDLFQSINPGLWENCDHNPIDFLEKIPLNRLKALERNDKFLDQLEKTYLTFKAYMDRKEEQKKPAIAYFSMEYGLHYSLRIYSGGLGILAGDYMKEASDQNLKMVGVGLLYRYGYFTQIISAKGQQVNKYEHSVFEKLPVQPVRDEEGNWVTVEIAFPGRKLKVRIWKVHVGRIELYLLDTDFEDNLPEDRSITHQLYGGNWENRLKQEILLGIGGIRALRKMEIESNVYHCNEGHAAFIGLERIKNIIAEENLSFGESLEMVRASTLFTTHTPVPAGHDAFPEELLRTYLGHFQDYLQISWCQFLNFGKIGTCSKNGDFSMSYLAANISQEVNGVSKLHGEISRKIFESLWPGYFAEELHLDYVTNGIHYPTWTSNDWREFYKEHLAKDFETRLHEKKLWEKIYDVESKKIWELKNKHRKELVEYLKERLANEDSYTEDPRYILQLREALKDNTLIVGFARRFATYKRAYLLFKNEERLKALLNQSDRPVLFVFAGKAHPNDKAGQDMIKMIVEISKRNGFVGKVLFVPDYEMRLAQKLVSGVDIWLNTPLRTMEASGTSGQKVLMNGGLNFSVLDGWWLEGYRPGAGWALSEVQSYDNDELQNEVDAELIYTIFENEILPNFYDRNKDGVPEQWVKYIKKSIAEIAPIYTTTRMMNDYAKKFYNRMYKRHNELIDNEYELVEKITTWKNNIFKRWEQVEVVSAKQLDISKQQVFLGQEYKGEVILNINGIDPDDIGVEMVVSEIIIGEERARIISKQEMCFTGYNDGLARYEVSIVPQLSGTFDYGFRIYPKNELLPHRLDFNLVKWV